MSNISADGCRVYREGYWGEDFVIDVCSKQTISVPWTTGDWVLCWFCIVFIVGMILLFMWAVASDGR